MSAAAGRNCPDVSVLAVLATAIAALSCGGSQDAVPQRHAVEVREFTYQPDTLRVAVGDTVVWANRDVVPHTATSDVWDSGALERDASWKLVVTSADTIAYVCALHPAMSGMLIIEDSNTCQRC